MDPINPSLRPEPGPAQHDPLFDVSGKIALITGASSGLGAHFAQLLAARGAKVVCAARRLDRLAEVVQAIKDQGGEAIAVSADVEDEASLIRAFDEAQSAFGAPTIVIANAGMNAVGLALDIDSADFDHVMSVNQRGVFLTAREGARRMVGAYPDGTSEGRIVLISSMAGTRPLPGLTAYSVSKAGVVMMAKGLAREWAKLGINVNAICPGYIETEINADWLQQPGGVKMLAGFPRKRVMATEALDGALMWLVSGAGRYTTGSIVQIDDAQGL
jgi:NAD(P)-dependent dehydrogenase (short-subunit alcohol dehydrogenase family)